MKSAATSRSATKAKGTREARLIFGATAGAVTFERGNTGSINPFILWVLWLSWGSAPGTTRTCDLLIRSQIQGETRLHWNTKLP